MRLQINTDSIVGPRFALAVLLVLFFLAGAATDAESRAKNKGARVATEQGRYMIILSSSPTAFKTSKLPRLKVFKKHRLYSVPFKNKGKRWQSLRLGFFKDKKSATVALRSVRRKYPDAWIVKLSAKSKRKYSRYTIKGATGKKKTALKRQLTLLGKRLLKEPKAGKGNKFDHFKTGFELAGTHSSIKCESCHVRGIFKGTPNKCMDCHRRGGQVTASGKPLTHIETNATCDDCHTQSSWTAALHMDHGSLFGTCISCHNGKVAAGKSPRHIRTTAQCDFCHSTSGWTSVRFDHGSVAGSCSTCHNGTSATGKGPSHITSSNVCDDCHSTNGWGSARFDHGSVAGSCSTCHNGTTAIGKGPSHVTSSNVCDDCHSTSGWTSVRFDHGSVTGSCSTCHNGTTAPGKGPTHITSSNICDDCHTPTVWTSVRFDHGSVTGSCSTCHNGTTATGKNPSHFITSVQCDDCHSTSGWIPVNTYRHSSGNYPGDHRTSVQCIDCHKSNSQTATWSYSGYKPDCAGCHAGNFKPDSHKKVDTPRINYTASELRNCAGSCHRYVDNTFTTTERTRSGEHRTGDGGW